MHVAVFQRNRLACDGPSDTLTGHGAPLLRPAPFTVEDEVRHLWAQIPEGAEVLINGALVNTTPCDFPRPTGSEIVQLTVRSAGYQERTIALTAFGDPDVSVVLERARTGGGGRRPTGGGSTEPSSTGGGTASPPPTTTPHSTGGSGGDGVIDPWGH